MRFFSLAILLATVCAGGISSNAQQLIPKQTAQQCAARGGSITTWTNTAGVGVDVGECYVPPSAGSAAPVSSNNGANNVALGFGIVGAGLGVIDSLQKMAPVSESEQPPELPLSSQSEPSFGSPSGPSPSSPREPVLSRDEQGSNGEAPGIFALALSQSKSNPCSASRNFGLAEQRFRAAGDMKAASDAQFQATFTEADCNDAQSAIASEKYVYYCVPEDGVYGRAYVPARPGEGCGRGMKSIPTPVPPGKTADQLRETLRDRLRKELAKNGGDPTPQNSESTSEGSTAKSADEFGQQWATTSTDTSPAAVASHSETNDEILQNFLNSENADGVTPGGEIRPRN